VELVVILLVAWVVDQDPVTRFKWTRVCAGLAIGILLYGTLDIFLSGSFHRPTSTDTIQEFRNQEDSVLSMIDKKCEPTQPSSHILRALEENRYQMILNERRRAAERGEAAMENAESRGRKQRATDEALRSFVR
jgi:hypothetical protein